MARIKFTVLREEFSVYLTLLSSEEVGKGFPRIITHTGPGREKREKEVVLSNCLCTLLLSAVGMVSHFCKMVAAP